MNINYPENTPGQKPPKFENIRNSTPGTPLNIGDSQTDNGTPAVSTYKKTRRSNAARRKLRRIRNSVIPPGIVKGKDALQPLIPNITHELQDELKASATPLPVTRRIIFPSGRFQLSESTPTEFKLAFYDQRDSGLKNIEEKESELLLTKLQDLLFEEMERDVYWLPTFYYTLVEDGFFYVNCVNEKSMKWVMNSVQDLQNLWPDSSIRMLRMPDLTSRWFAVVGVHEDDKMPTEKIIRLLMLQNPGLRFDEWILHRRKLGKSKKLNLMVSMSMEDRDVLAKKRNKLFYKFNRVDVNMLNYNSCPRYLGVKGENPENGNLPENRQIQEKEESLNDSQNNEENFDDEDQDDQSVDLEDILNDDFFNQDGNWEVIDQE